MWSQRFSGWLWAVLFEFFSGALYSVQQTSEREPEGLMKEEQNECSSEDAALFPFYADADNTRSEREQSGERQDRLE